MWRKWFKIFGAKVVQTMDMDGDVRYRFAYKNEFGGFKARRIWGWAKLNDDGTCSLLNGNSCYVKRWTYV